MSNKKQTATAKATTTCLPKWFKWTIEIQVDKTWVEDGFDMNNERAHDMLAKELSSAYNTELKARVIAKPDRKLIRKAQGYSK